MTRDDEFEPKLGKIRSLGRKRGRRYLQQVLHAAALAGGSRHVGAPSRRGTFHGNHIGRGAGVGRVLASRDRYASYRQRRVVIKSRIIKLTGNGLKGAQVRLVLNQIGRRLTERLEGDPRKRRKHQLLMMLDEFPALGRLDFFETALAFMAGYGIRAYLIAQSLNQISKAYGENNAILDNCHVRIAFSSNDERTAKRISDALGTATELRAQRNYAGHRLAPWLSHVMISRQETARPLLTPGEVMQLPPADELVLVSGLAPIRAKKLRYYEDRNFTSRVAPAPELAADGYRDRPAPRPDDWSGRVRGLHLRLAASIDEEAGSAEEEGGPQQQRHPGLAEEDVAKPNRQQDSDLGLADDESDVAADKDVVDRLRGLGAVGRAHAMNEGEPTHRPDHDLLPDF